MRQCRLMTKPTRIVSLLVFFGCMALTLLVATRGGIESLIPCLILAGCQFCAALYYFMSFIVSVIPHLRPLLCVAQSQRSTSCIEHCPVCAMPCRRSREGDVVVGSFAQRQPVSTCLIRRIRWAPRFLYGMVPNHVYPVLLISREGASFDGIEVSRQHEVNSVLLCVIVSASSCRFSRLSTKLAGIEVTPFQT